MDGGASEEVLLRMAAQGSESKENKKEVCVFTIVLHKVYKKEVRLG